jgi:2-dehydro-3-deoxygalactonokinase
VSAAPAPAPEAVAWLAADWGGSRLRVWAMGADDRPLAQARSDAGAASLTPEGFEPALRALAAPWLMPGRVTQAVACGMVGSRQGWVEAPYRPVPCAPLGAGAVAAPVRGEGLALRVIPGLSQADPPDVMRGEETQIAGALREAPGFEGVVCLPGTHAKWATVAGGRVTAFRTFLTGELFALLSGHSSLRHGLGGAQGWDAAAFGAAAAEAAADPGRLGALLFGVRAAGLVAGLAPPAARARLSGLLIGAEIGAARDLWRGRAVLIVGSAALASAYAAALAGQGAHARMLDAAETTLAGLCAARAMEGPWAAS